MKKLIIFLLIGFLGIAGYAQERTVSLTLKNGVYYYKYSGTSADTLKPTNQDTIDYVFQYQSPEYIKKIAIKMRFDPVSGADTTVTYSLFGKEFSDDGTYVQIIGATAGTAVTADNISVIATSDPYETTASYLSAVASYNGVLTMDTTALFPNTTTDSTFLYKGTTVNAAHNITNAAQTTTTFDKSYRYYRLRLILTGDDSVGTGIEVDEIEFKLYTD